MDPLYNDLTAHHTLTPTTTPGETLDEIIDSISPIFSNPGRENNVSFDFIPVNTGDSEGAFQNVDLNIGLESVEKPEDKSATVCYLTPDSSASTSVIEQSVENTEKSVQPLRITDSPAWKKHTTSHPRCTRYSRLSKEQLPPHSYDLVHKHIQPVSEDPNGAHQCVYAIRENSICSRSFNLKSEAKAHVAEEHFKKNTKFEQSKGTPGNKLLRSVVRVKIDPATIDDTSVGVCHAHSPLYLSRAAALSVGVLDHVPTYTINRLCSSGLMTIRSISQSIKAGDATLRLALGVESMSLNPWAEPLKWSPKPITSPALNKIPTSCSRIRAPPTPSNPAYSLTKSSLSKLPAKSTTQMTQSDQRRRKKGDSAAIAVITTRERAEKEGWEVQAKWAGCAVVGVDPRYMGISPVVAIPKILRKTRVDERRYRSLGAGVRMLATGLAEIQRRKQEIFCTSMCIGSGMGTAAIYVNEMKNVPTIQRPYRLSYPRPAPPPTTPGETPDKIIDPIYIIVAYISTEPVTRTTRDSGEGFQDVDLNIGLESIEKPEDKSATVCYLTPDSSASTSVIEQSAENTEKSVQPLRIKDNPAWKKHTTSHPRSTRHSRLSKKQPPPHSYDLVHKHIRPVSEDPNGAHQCVYAIRENSICRRSFILKSEAKDHVVEDHFKRSAKFECCW
ncbi:hypothetical protein M422DRAFT_273431 [Sphaerobolus stellatus SS14]|uniref:Thiolase N-terminal domain-containing protein n=1 Tax=Sphaerobolus stellatus (strain SS14) TaxID=990650 RepID=A0A0C9UK23_SPHS4|nr:hypothetical protein M422DRAFT_273431 [Sphaerobolus stellatus SS14]